MQIMPVRNLHIHSTNKLHNVVTIHHHYHSTATAAMTMKFLPYNQHASILQWTFDLFVGNSYAFCEGTPTRSSYYIFSQV